jgi:hypothetical protein
MVQKNAVTTLVKAMDANRDDAASSAALVPTFTKLATSPERCTKLLHSGAIEAVIRTLVAHPEFENHSAEALGFFEHLGTSDFDMQKLVDMGVIPATVAAMKAFPTNTGLQVGGLSMFESWLASIVIRQIALNARVQLNGTRVLVYLCFSEESARAIGTAGCIPIVTANVAPERPKDLVTTSLYLMTSLSALPSNKDLIVKDAGSVDLLLTAVATYSQDEVVQENAQELLAAVLGEEQVAASVKDFGKALDVAIKTKSKADCRKVKDLANRVVALSATQDFAELLFKAGGVEQLSRTLDEVSQLTGLPEAEGIMSACCSALSSLSLSAADNGELRGIIAQSGAVKSVVSSVKLQPKLARSVSSALTFLEVRPQLSSLFFIPVSQSPHPPPPVLPLAHSPTPLCPRRKMRSSAMEVSRPVSPPCVPTRLMLALLPLRPKCCYSLLSQTRVRYLLRNTAALVRSSRLCTEMSERPTSSCRCSTPFHCSSV